MQTLAPCARKNQRPWLGRGAKSVVWDNGGIFREIEKESANPRCNTRRTVLFTTQLDSPRSFVRQMTGLLQALDEIKGVHLEPRGQGKIDGVLAEYYVSVFAPVWL